MEQKKILFNFYIDPKMKDDLQDKLERLIGEKPKGTIAALIRVYLKMFLTTPDEKINPMLLEAINAEYEYSAKLNKRSRLWVNI